MIDTLSIVISTLLCVFVVFRAVRLNRVLPWYEALRDPASDVTSVGQTAEQIWIPDWERPPSSIHPEHKMLGRSTP